MYKVPKFKNSSITKTDTYIGETIEEKCRRIESNKEPITDGAPLIYSDRKDGVLPSYNIRTDRMEAAVEAMEAVNKSKIAKREEKAKPAIEVVNGKKETGGQSIQGTDQQAPTT